VNQKRDLQREVLEHLKTHGPCHYGGLCVLFDVQSSAEIGAALVNLLQWKHIERDKNNMVTMTAAGRQWLEALTIPPSTADPR